MSDDDEPVKFVSEDLLNGLPDELLPSDEECDALFRDLRVSMSLNCPELLDGRSLFDDQFEIKNGKVTKTDNPFRAMRSMASKHSRIDRTEFPNGGFVSTVAVVNASRVPFETMAFEVGPFSGTQQRWASLGEAKRGHHALVHRIRAFNAWLKKHHRVCKKWWKRAMRYARYADERSGWAAKRRTSMIHFDRLLSRIPGQPETPLYWELHGLAAFIATLREHASLQGYGQPAAEGDGDYE